MARLKIDRHSGRRTIVYRGLQNDVAMLILLDTYVIVSTLDSTVSRRLLPTIARFQAELTRHQPDRPDEFVKVHSTAGS